MSYRIAFSPAFRRAVKKLEKKYRNIKNDLEAALLQLEKHPEGDSIPGFENKVRKIRVALSSEATGKRGGLRLIYHVDEEHRLLTMLLVYPKREQADATKKEILDALKTVE